jgi:hypothetical protein
MKHRTSTEGAIQRAVFAQLRMRPAAGVAAFHVPNGGYRRPIEAAIMNGQGVLSGVFDVIAVKNGRAYALELKRAGGRLSQAQSAAHAALRDAGAVVATTFCLDDAIIALGDWGLLHGRASVIANRVREQR